MNRRELIAGAALIGSVGAANAFGASKMGGRGGFGGLGVLKKSNTGGGGGPFTPLPGSAIDMDFVGGNYFGGTLADLMNSDQTQATGALLAALVATTGTMLVQLKALAAPPDGTNFWFQITTASRHLYGQSNTQFRTRQSGTITTATLGSGTFTGGPTKLGLSWDGVITASLVGNNGTVVSGDLMQPGGVSCAINLPVLTNFIRLTVWNTKLPDATLKGFTV